MSPASTSNVKRITPPPLPEPAQVSASDFKEDLQRGFCVVESNPARTEKLRNHRNGTSIIRQHAAEHVLRCMRCQFDTVNGNVTVDASTKKPITGMDIMTDHLSHGQHPWPYDNPFTNPYGNVADVVIEGQSPGVAYSQFLASQDAAQELATASTTAPTKTLRGEYPNQEEN